MKLIKIELMLIGILNVLQYITNAMGDLTNIYIDVRFVHMSYVLLIMTLVASTTYKISRLL